MIYECVKKQHGVADCQVQDDMVMTGAKVSLAWVVWAGCHKKEYGCNGKNFWYRRDSCPSPAGL